MALHEALAEFGQSCWHICHIWQCRITFPVPISSLPQPLHSGRPTNLSAPPPPSGPIISLVFLTLASIRKEITRSSSSSQLLWEETGDHTAPDPHSIPIKVLICSTGEEAVDPVFSRLPHLSTPFPSLFYDLSLGFLKAPPSFY